MLGASLIQISWETARFYPRLGLALPIDKAEDEEPPLAENMAEASHGKTSSEQMTPPKIMVIHIVCECIYIRGIIYYDYI